MVLIAWNKSCSLGDWQTLFQLTRFGTQTKHRLKSANLFQCESASYVMVQMENLLFLLITILA